MITKILNCWDWRLATLGTTTSAVLSQTGEILGFMGLLLTLLSATATLFLTITKVLDWYEERDNKNEE